MRFEQPTAPHARPLVSVPVIMRRVLYALVPAALCHTWYFGPGLLVNFALTALAALFTEALVLKLRGRKTRHALSDWSALETAAALPQGALRRFSTARRSSTSQPLSTQ